MNTRQIAARQSEKAYRRYKARQWIERIADAMDTHKPLRYRLDSTSTTRVWWASIAPPPGNK